MALINQLFHCPNAEKMQCKATIVEFDPNDWMDRELIEKLELKNDNAYGWYGSLHGFSRTRAELHDDNEMQKILEELENLSPNYKAQTVVGENVRIFKVVVGDDTYEITSKKMKRIVRAIDLSRWFLYRCDERSKEVEFYAEKKILTPKRKCFNSIELHRIFCK